MRIGRTMTAWALVMVATLTCVSGARAGATHTEFVGTFFLVSPCTVGGAPTGATFIAPFSFACHG